MAMPSFKPGARYGKALLPLLATLAMPALLLALPLDHRLLLEVFLVFAMAQGWNLLCGYTGLLSFGHQAFVGVGAYALFMSMNTFGVTLYIGLAASLAISALVALAMALLLHRLRDAYFSIGIWVLADILRLLFGQWNWVGSSRGVVLNTSHIDLISFNDTVFWLALLLATTTQLVVYAVLKTRMGLGLMAIRDNDAAAASVGIASGASKITAFVISAVICGVAGGIYYLSVLYADPSGAFDLSWQITMLFIVIVGGVGTLEGPIIGTLLYFGLRELLKGSGDMFLIVQGVTAALVMLAAPGGIWGVIQARTGWSLFSTRWLAD
ncbi:MAG: branched-chain amino acid ABC transporter permease [Maritimibacter sp.]